MSRLMEDKVGIVTAAGSGLGRASALCFASEGAKVVVSDINEVAGVETVDLIKQEGGEAIFIKCDVTNEDDIKLLVAKTVAAFGKLDWAHNNAGWGIPNSDITEVELEGWRKTQSLTLESTYLCMKHQIPEMLKSGGGAIVNTASISGLVGVPFASPYSAAKAAVNGLTKTVAIEYATRGIRINSICPGTTLTPAVEQWMKDAPEIAKELTGSIPMGRLGTPEEQANAAVWLCSDKASYITGVNLAIDGGTVAQ
ncbi:glucose 1-dehydrogenase [Schinkia azotoformans]|uniref:glucose 1-dehydrogenase n=1 Tax=Schinkia azotoformans TaxID=1454 RepID=UPI002E23B09E|nr:glucose 1-dehydrogenase [Schinkia azotoformans]MED4355117.1 glucose 1-dehydrogenase [Schinkia azotoformans]